jgi:hypothetical protein
MTRKQWKVDELTLDRDEWGSRKEDIARVGVTDHADYDDAIDVAASLHERRRYSAMQSRKSHRERKLTTRHSCRVERRRRRQE